MDRIKLGDVVVVIMDHTKNKKINTKLFNIVI